MICPAKRLRITEDVQRGGLALPYSRYIFPESALPVCLVLQVTAVYLPFLQMVLHTVPLTIADWGLIAACSLAPAGVVELAKVVQRSNAGATPAR